jgi:hypothetical protein
VFILQQTNYTTHESKALYKIHKINLDRQQPRVRACDGDGLTGFGDERQTPATNGNGTSYERGVLEREANSSRQE